MRTSHFAHLLALGLVLALGSIAHAGGDAPGAPAPSPGTNAGVVVAGEATMQAPLASQLEGWLKTHGHEVVASPLEPDAINTLVDCFVIEDESCAIGVISKRAKSETVVFARIDVTSAADGTRDVTLTGYWFHKGQHAVTERRFCERCTELLLRNTADDLMLALSGAGLVDAGHLKLGSDPTGGHVIIDGHTVGVTPIELALPPGSHDLSVTADGHKVELRTITIKRGETVTLDMHLLPGTGKHDGDHPEGDDAYDVTRHPRFLPYTMIGVGGAGVVAGVVMIIAGGKPSASGKQSPTYTDTRPPGIGIAIGGAVVAGAGVWLWMHWKHEATSAPAVTLGDGGGTIGWTGSF